MMHDQNGKTLRVGDSLYTYRHGLCRITVLNEDWIEALAEDPKRSENIGCDAKTFFDNIRGSSLKVRSWAELAEEALRVQDACNLSGVVNGFAIIVKEVRILLESEGTFGNESIHRHPVCKLFADKIASLTGVQNAPFSELSSSYNWAYEQTKSL